jgi:hypothetical protein
MKTSSTFWEGLPPYILLERQKMEMNLKKERAKVFETIGVVPESAGMLSSTYSWRVASFLMAGGTLLWCRLETMEFQCRTSLW